VLDFGIGHPRKLTCFGKPCQIWPFSATGLSKRTTTGYISAAIVKRTNAGKKFSPNRLSTGHLCAEVNNAAVWSLFFACSMVEIMFPKALLPSLSSDSKTHCGTQVVYYKHIML
jgi:hypothetical protein